jgi:hypothetical protein
VRVIDVVTSRVPAIAEERREDPLTEDTFRAVYDLLASRGVPMRPFDDAWADVRMMRATYLSRMNALADALVVSTEFRPAGVPLPASMTWDHRGPS